MPLETTKDKIIFLAIAVAFVAGPLLPFFLLALK